MKSYSIIRFFAAIGLALAVGYIGALLAQPSQPRQAVADETAYQRILRTGVLKCGYALWPPLVLNKDANTGQMSGLAKDIIETAAKNLKLKVQWVEETGWGSWIEGLKNGRFDVFCGTAWQSAAIGREVRYTVPVFYNPVYAYVRADDTRFDKGFDILNDPAIRISGQDGEVSESVARDHFPKAAYIGQPQMSELGLIFMNVAQAKADIVFNAPDTAEAFMNKNPGLLKRVSDTPFEFFSASYAVAMNEVNLQQMLDTALIEMRNNGILEKILKDNNAPADQFLRISVP